MTKLNDPAFPDANGKTILENATTLLGGELGGLPHGHSDLTFFVAGAKERFQRGVLEMNGRSDVDLYETIVASLDIETKFGDQDPTSRVAAGRSRQRLSSGNGDASKGVLSSWRRAIR